MNRDIEIFFQKSVEDGVFPGCCAAVIHQGKTDYYCVGKREILPSPVPNDLMTRYDLASLTKVVSTTMIVLRLIKEGRLGYDTAVNQIIPEFANAEITIRHLLTHTSGLPADFAWAPQTGKKEIMREINRASLVFLPGSHVLYSDLGFILLGEMIERVTHLRLDQAAEHYVFKPLHMAKTGYCPDAALKYLCAATEISPHYHYLLKGEVHDHKASMMNGVAGHAGVFSTIEDMAKYANMLLNDGWAGKERFLESWQIADLYRCLTPVGETGRGIGFLVKDAGSPFAAMNTEKSFMHTGFTGTSILVDIDLDLAVVVLSNRVHPTRENTRIISWRREMHTFIIEKILQNN